MPWHSWRHRCCSCTTSPRCAKPLLDLSIFRNGKFTLPILSAFLLYTAISLATTLAPFYFQGAMGYTASEVGYISMVVPLFMMFRGAGQRRDLR